MARSCDVEVWLGGRQRQGADAPKIEIVATPPGEAPNHVRREWVGLVIPALHDHPVRQETVGVLSPPRTRLGWWLRRMLRRTEEMTGYVVVAKDALDTLAVSAPDAADWWRANAPEYFDDEARLMFPADVCRRVRTEPPRPANSL